MPACSALPSCISASMQRVSTAPAKRSFSVFTPWITGSAITSCAKSRYTSSMRATSSCASACVACAVWPSCHRNSPVRRKSRVRSSQRITFAHWFNSIGRSRYESIHFLKKWPMIVSEVGRTT